MSTSSILIGGTPPPGSFGIPGVQGVVDPTFGAQRVSTKPDEYQFQGQVLGHYEVSNVTGNTTGIAANGLIYSMQWTDTKSLFLLRKITVGASIITAFTTGQPVDVEGIIVRNFATPDTGGTQITFPANSQKCRVNMGPSLIPDARIAAAAALTPGATKTPDQNAFCFGVFALTNAAGSSNMFDAYSNNAQGQHPIICGFREGFNLRIPTAQGAAGVVKYYIKTVWSELPGY